MARYRRFDVTGRSAEAPTGAIESVRVRRAGLKSAMSGLEIAIAAPAPGRTEEWAAGVRDALAVLQEVWTRHVVETEAPGAFLDDLVEEAPRLYNQSLRLREEHGEIMSILLDVEDHMLPDPTDPEWVDRLRAVLTSLLVALARHRQRGADLVYEAYAVDIGGGF
ncbi:MAG: hypothetical protein ACRDV7_14675 [Acidimicrobiia bacterium]|jgi:hypothetical protein